MEKSASRASRFGSGRGRPWTISRGSTPAIQTLRPRSSTSRPSSRSNVTGSSSRRSDLRAWGSRLSAMSWLPSTAKTGLGSTRASRLSIGSPRGCVRRSPLIATRSGRRSRTHTAACHVAPTPGDGTPKWKSERCAIRSPSSSAGSPGSSTSSSRSRGRPASTSPQPRAARPDPTRSKLQFVTCARRQASSRSSAGRGSTMWRLNLSSESSRPAATPTSCARWRIGRRNVLPSRPRASAARHRARGGRAGTASPSRRRLPRAPARRAG